MTKLEQDLLRLLEQWVEHAKDGTQDVVALIALSKHTLATRPAPMIFTTATQRMAADRLRKAGKTWRETGEALGLDGNNLRKSLARHGYKAHGHHPKVTQSEGAQ
jgi:hypothetical protein